MQESQGSYNILADRLVCWSFCAAFLVLVCFMILTGPTQGPDDIMRWVSVLDLQNGQGWFDPYQHRLGPDEGTLMHWSRIVDVPIAAIYWVSSAFLPAKMALTATALIWPSFLAGITLWAFAATGGALGNRAGAISALVMGVFALMNSGKFDQYSFDHHGLQVLLFVYAVMFFVLRKDKPHAGLWMGFCLALSVSIGAESLLQIGIIGLFVAIDWVLSGLAARRRSIEFGTAIVLTLLVAVIATTSRDSFYYPGCDALTLNVVLPAGLAAAGLPFAALVASNRALTVRATCLLVLGGSVVVVAQMFAPYCLENPVNHMASDVRDFWLSQVTEAQNVTLVIQRYAGETIALICIAIFSIFAAALFAYKTEPKIEYLLFLFLIAAGFVLFLYQSRMMTFLTVSLVAVQAQVLRVMYRKYKVEDQRSFGVLMILFVALMSPKTGASLEKSYKAMTAVKEETNGQSHAAPVLSCTTENDFLPLKELEPGLIVADFDFASYILLYTDHSVLAGNYHRNEAGIIAQIDLFRSKASEIGPRLDELGVDYIMVCKPHPRAAYWSSVSDGDGLPAELLRGDLPDGIEEIPGKPDAAFLIFRVNA
ncbi:hypothetical protein [uncultured Ruegeria sp.]|jgi:asparagine N-glycosylation enzyme membrane subunit Stt3|uniref:hypothetical protein n=1 Tax=uncultured Ruegeria sp. TaxID=259304 RepID=UPI002618F0FA|nr:hypothetical protein [uncultured Ruegeria sp.]